MSPWWKRITNPGPDPVLDLAARQRLFVATAPLVVPAPSPHAELAAARIRIEALEEELSTMSDVLVDALADKRTAEAAALEECTAHGTTMGHLRRVSAHLDRAREDVERVREERDAARVAETMCSVSRCPRCQHDVECLPIGWWCDECTRAYPEEACDYASQTVGRRIVDLGGQSRWFGNRARVEIDPGDTAKVGEPTPATCCGPGPRCGAASTYICTRLPGHAGQHVATTLRYVVEVWPNDGHLEGLASLRGTRFDADRRPCAKCTDRVHTLSARDWCDSCEGQDADELIEKARALGDEVGQRDRTAAVEGAAITLRAHARQIAGPGRITCMCGWGGSVPWKTLTDHAHHQAEQLAAVGALGGSGRFTLTPGSKVPVRVYGTALDGTWAGHVVDGDGHPVVEIEPVVEQAKAAT